MGGTVKIRLINDLWWGEVPIEETLNWNHFTVTKIDDKFCYVTVNGEQFEMEKSDYNKLLDSKAFRTKFDIKKFSFSK